MPGLGLYEGRKGVGVTRKGAHTDTFAVWSTDWGGGKIDLYL